MNYCSLDDAFQAIGGAPTPGCAGSQDTAAKQARREERRKAKKCKGPALTFFDPDRPVQETVESYQGEEDFHHKKHLPNQDVPNFDKDPLYSYVQREVSDHVMKVSGSTTEAYAPTATPVKRSKSFFGADPDDMADPEEPPAPIMETFDPSDYTAAFQPTRLSAPSAPQPATSSMPFPNMYWKSKTPAQSAFVEHLPPMPISSNRVQRDPEMAELTRKMDRLFSQLEELKGGGASPEQMTSEIMMFISSGIVILFLMDLMVKKGHRM